MSQFSCDVTLLTTADSGPRDPRACLWGMFHTTENSDTSTPEAIAKWQQDRRNESSYNVLFGADATGARTVRSNDDNFCPWSAGMPGNRLAIHGSAVGRASRTRADWLANPRQLENMARWAADLHTRYGVPLVWLTVDEVRGQRARGFTSHDVYWKAIARAQGMEVRTDPGSGFPHDVVLDRAKQIVNPPPPKEATNMSGDNRPDMVLDQLVGYPWKDFPGWDQLGGLSLVDAVATIGHTLGIDGFRDMRGGRG